MKSKDTYCLFWILISRNRGTNFVSLAHGKSGGNRETNTGDR